MTLKLISYDLSKPGRNYEDLYDSIKNIGTWWHCLESVWIVETNLSCGEIRDQLSAYLDGNDKLAVLTLQGGWATSGLSQECNDWLRNHL
tara:strand:- start:1335 stop:1604 length:270 start_codon:yes stop_codon:yes gene_type:complete